MKQSDKTRGVCKTYERPAGAPCDQIVFACKTSQNIEKRMKTWSSEKRAG
jgi:hypothetical protein